MRQKIPVLALNLVRRELWRKQAVWPPFEQREISVLTEVLVGMHSARLTTPFLACRARVPQFCPQQWQTQHETKSVIKLRCMRKTLHTISCRHAAILHQATVDFRLLEIRRQHKLLSTGERRVSAIKDKILTAVEAGPLPSTEIEKAVSAQIRMSGKELNYQIRTTIRELWETGLLCYLDRSMKWGTEQRRYGLTAKEFPRLDLSEIDPGTAQRKLLLAYISAYGPATIKDMHWWSGISRRRIVGILQELCDEIQAVRVESFNQECFLTRANYNYLGDARSRLSEDPWVEFLAYEDPSLKGYFETRSRYVSPCHLGRLFNKIGEARPSVVVSGSVVGIWGWHKHKERLYIELFRTLERTERKLVEGAAARVIQFLFGSGCAALPIFSHEHSKQLSQPTENSWS